MHHSFSRNRYSAIWFWLGGKNAVGDAKFSFFLEIQILRPLSEELLMWVPGKWLPSMWLPTRWWPGMPTALWHITKWFTWLFSLFPGYSTRKKKGNCLAAFQRSSFWTFELHKSILIVTVRETCLEGVYQIFSDNARPRSELEDDSWSRSILDNSLNLVVQRSTYNKVGWFNKDYNVGVFLSRFRVVCMCHYLLLDLAGEW